MAKLRTWSEVAVIYKVVIGQLVIEGGEVLPGDLQGFVNASLMAMLGTTMMNPSKAILAV